MLSCIRNTYWQVTRRTTTSRQTFSSVAGKLASMHKHAAQDSTHNQYIRERESNRYALTVAETVTGVDKNREHGKMINSITVSRRCRKRYACVAYNMLEKRLSLSTYSAQSHYFLLLLKKFFASELLFLDPPLTSPVVLASASEFIRARYFAE